MANDFEDGVRARVRQLRFERGLTQAEVAAAAGMATSTLSRLESGARRLTLAHVAVLARALGVDPGAVTGGARDDPAPARDGRLWWPLLDDGSGSRVYRVRLPAAAGEPVPHSHEGHQWLYVLRGRVRLVLEGAEARLETGEATGFDTWRPHWIAGLEDPTELLVIFDPGGGPPRTVTGRQVPQTAR